MNFKKRVNGSWTDTPHYIHKTSTDTITTLPAVLYPNNTTATVGLKGNMSQTGTPTPQSPVMPQGTGERTAQLFDKDNATLYNLFPGTENTIRVSSNARSIAIPCVGGETYTVSKKAGQRFMVCFTTEPIATQVTYTELTTNNTATSITVVAPLEAKYLFVYFYNSTADVDTVETLVNSIMINTGSPALPYDKFGIKIPISSASTTTPVYLGEVETTRKVKKVVLTGEEDTNFYKKNATSADNSLYYIRFSALQSVPLNGSPLYCTHLPNINYTPTEVVGITVGFNYNVIYFNLGLDVMNAQPSGNTITGLKEYLAAQYAAGTPVTIWYVLATPETAVVNEPIRKIGDYADTISGITIPTIAGGDTISVDTTLQPSEVAVNYKGWHPVADVHERENGAWT